MPITVLGAADACDELEDGCNESEDACEQFEDACAEAIMLRSCRGGWI